MGSQVEAPILYDLKVYNDSTGEMLGYVTSIDEVGLEMLVDQAIDLERENFFALENILEMEPGHTALFAATCDECELEAADEDKYHVRLTFTQMSNEASELKEVLH